MYHAFPVLTSPLAIRYPEDLPICQRRQEILAAIRSHQVVVIAGETGSGKTTQLPKMCLEAGLASPGRPGRIGCTQPRRVAALSVSRRVAEELGVVWGREVGCKMRFNDDTSRETLVKFMTDGILLAEIQSDPALRHYSCLILDEAHERSLNIDFLLGYLQGLLKRRPELKLLITSATIDTEAFSRAFGGAPIIEVSGRLYPVEILHRSLETYALPGESIGEVDHIDAAIRATEDALIESEMGDVLVFMPTERDIRDTCEGLEGSLGQGIDVLGLYGRMPAGEQQRIFSPGARRRVIVATNIAETSITLPRIRYVVDAGLSRVSRYNPRTRTKRLPVEPVSQSSANQRAGRAGRVQAGICIRLYDEEDFGKRPRFTQPEIQRANLAEVILRMKAFRLGEIETFPFINPPASAAIRAGYALLHELAALDETNQLTALGQELARLPVDPTLGRMLLQAREERALDEMLIIAAGLSVPDPRERPEEQKEAAAAAHRAFSHPESDFLSLKGIWEASPQAEGRGNTNSLRRFCKANFLSFSRMREWRDIHKQLRESMAGDKRAAQRTSARPTHESDSGPARLPDQNSAQRDYRAIHRAILAGLLGHIAQRLEKNGYKASGNRQVTIFPGSVLYERREKKTKSSAPTEKDAKVRQPLWIVSGEIVETSQLFARNVAGIDPQWVVDLAPHLCQRRHTEPHWSAKAGRVLALERVLIFGLEVSRSLVDYGRIDPVQATEIFIRGALISEEARLPHLFFTENRKVREKIETALTRVRSRRAHDLDEALYLFYAARIKNVSSTHDLNKLVREWIGREPRFLCATEEDLIGDDDATYDRALFPDQVTFGQAALPLSYAYVPGEDRDGVTVQVPLPLAEQLTSGQIQWMVPGLREEQIATLLRALPKSVRRGLMPLEPKVREVASAFQPGQGDFLRALATFLSQKYRVPVRAEDWPARSLPAHLQPRVEVLDAAEKMIVSGRDLAAIRTAVGSHEVHSSAWDRAVQKWERLHLEEWSFGDLPESIVVEQVHGASLLGYPGLLLEVGKVRVQLFRKSEEVSRHSPAAIRRLAEIVLGRELARLWKELAGFAKFIPMPGKSAPGFHSALQQVGSKLQTPSFSLSAEVLQKSAYSHLLDHTLVLQPLLPLAQTRFEHMLTGVRQQLPALTFQLGEWTRQILSLRQAILLSSKRYPGMEADVERLAPADFLARTPHSQIHHLHRYLRAIQVRAERAAINPGKDAERVRLLNAFSGWRDRVLPEREQEYRWGLEEYRVSVFAQELGTAYPVSPKRLLALEGR